MERRSALGFKGAILVVGALALAGSIPAQTPDNGPPGSAAPQAAQPNLPPQQLDNLVAPIALYPDPLLGEVLAASTYPVELVEAHQWLQTNNNLSGQQLMDAARQQDWDPSVQALVAMPDVMSLLTQDIRWTTDLGNAFLAQQADVMSAVQRMRQRAQANGQLRTTPQETVTTQNDNGQQAIDIEPASPDVMYVPAYDPYYVYGYGAYPPLYYPDGYWFGAGINIGFYFGGWGGYGYGGWGAWGWRPNWYGRSLYVNSGFFSRYGYHYGGYGAGRNIWTHDPVHRLGARYPNSQLTSRFGAASQAARVNAGRSGNWHSFGGGNAVGSQNSFRSSTPNVQGFQRFGGNNVNNNGAQRFGGAQRSSNSQQTFQPAPQQQRSFQPAPQQRSAPAFQSAPRMSAPSAPRMSGGGGGFGGGGGHVSGGGGGGGSAHGGGGGHGGRR